MELAAVLRGLARAHGCEELARMRERCMQQDVSWERSAAAWEAALAALVQEPAPEPPTAASVADDCRSADSGSSSNLGASASDDCVDGHDDDAVGSVTAQEERSGV